MWYDCILDSDTVLKRLVESRRGASPVVPSDPTSFRLLLSGLGGSSSGSEKASIRRLEGSGDRASDALERYATGG